MASAVARMYCQNTLVRQGRRLPETVGDSPGLHAGKHERLGWRNSTCKSQNGFQKMVGYVCRAVRVGRPDNDFAVTIPFQVVREGCVGRWQVGDDQIKRRQVSRQLLRHAGFMAEQPVEFPLPNVNDNVGIGRVARQAEPRGVTHHDDARPWKRQPQSADRRQGENHVADRSAAHDKYPLHRISLETPAPCCRFQFEIDV